MRIVFFLLTILMACPGVVKAQTDKEKEARTEKIGQCRRHLKAAFVEQDKAAGHIWLDSLKKFDGPGLSTTIWDERWMLYYWLDDYDTLLDEVEGHNLTLREEESANYIAWDDSLFQVLDTWLYEHRADKLADINEKIPAQEDRDFATLHLDYLLRLCTQGEARKEQDRKLEEFIAQYPRSRFHIFARLFMYEGSPVPGFALDLDLGLTHGTWTNEAERTLRPLFALHAGLGYWNKHFNVQTVVTYGQVKLDRPVHSTLGDWPKDAPANYLDWSVELGYDILDRDRVRIYPSAGVGFSWLHPPSPDDEEEPLPVYYDNFYFSSPSFTGAITADLKFKGKSDDDDSEQYSYNGLRIRLGYRLLNFGADNTALGGNMAFFAAAFNLYGRQTTRRSL